MYNYYQVCNISFYYGEDIKMNKTRFNELLHTFYLLFKKNRSQEEFIREFKTKTEFF